MLNTLKSILIIGLLATGLVAHAQQVRFTALPGPQVWHGTTQLSNAWAGGLNSPQLSLSNLDGDGVPDLFIFDRIGNKPSCFLGSSSGFRWAYNPWYEQQLPPMNSWAQMHDWNCDGLSDILCSNPFGMQAFQGLGTGTRFAFSSAGPYVETLGFSGAPVNLQVGYGDIPSIRDMDGDGDLDVLNITFGSATIEYNQNTGTGCGLNFAKRSACWGGIFLANTCGSFTFNACRSGAEDGPVAPQPLPGSPTAPQHLGTTLHLVDLNGDGNLDLLTGDVGCTSLFAFINQGTTAAPRFNGVLPTFPAGTTPAEFFSFLAATTLDVDQDGDLDLIVHPNMERNENFLGNMKESCWLYLNTGTNQNPSYTLSTTSYLQNTMVDLGENAYPVFADVDGDGDQDLLVSHAGERNVTRVYSSIWHYENTGSQGAPRYELRTTDWLNLSSLSQLHLKFTFHDLNADGAPDMVYTATNATMNQSFTRYAINQRAAGQGLDFNQAGFQDFLPNLPILASPAFVDISGDGLADLLVGRGAGGIAYYLNTGTTSNPSFTLNNSDWGNLLSAPFIGYGLNLAVADLNNDGNPDLLTGDENGLVRMYYSINQLGANPLLADTTLYRDLQTGLVNSWYLGKHIAPAVAQLTPDNQPDVVLGMAGGGLLYLENTTGYPLQAATTLQSKPSLSCYPIPTTTELNIRTTPGAAIQLQDLVGRVLWSGWANSEGILRLDLSNSSTFPSSHAGLLIVTSTSGGAKTSQKVVVGR